MNEFKDYQDRIIKFIKIADLGIDDILSEKKKTRKLDLWSSALQTPDIYTLHKKYDKNNVNIGKAKIDFSYESLGTQKLFSISVFILKALKYSEILIIDELESSLHPSLTKLIVEMFNSKEINRNNAQLIFTTHDVTLLRKDNFRRDQIWFTEKDKYGATDLYSLVDFKVRNDASFDKDYILGKYGAIPFLGNPLILFGESDG